MKTKICSKCGNDCFYWSSSLKACKDCAMRIKATEASLSPVKPRKPLVQYNTTIIKKVSTRQQKLNAAYKILRDSFMKKHTICMAGLEGCNFNATECHHSRGRGDYLLDDSTFKALCNPCHRYLETHPELSRQMGFTFNRLDNI